MSSSSSVSELVLRWQEAQQNGENLSVEELCRDCPAQLEEVRKRIQALQSMQKFCTLTETLKEDTPSTQRADPVLWPEVPGYEILGELGRGGMGVVYKARHKVLNRIVALKMILAGRQAGIVQRRRLRTEAEVLARIAHPNIVQIYEVHECDGCPCLSLEFVDGGSLGRLAVPPLLPVRSAAQLIRSLAQAVHVVHQQGILHRDLKPDNILMTREGVPKITDFGLAKKLDEDQGPTQSGSILGTPVYMAPEAANKQVASVGVATDVYGLGVILYELLTGKPPFTGHDYLEIIQKVGSEDPIPPRQLRPEIPRDLETIVLTCMRKRPDSRYLSAEALADDLGRFLAQQPVQARPIGLRERLLKWSRRQPVLLLILIAFAVQVAALGAGGLWFGLAVCSLAGATVLGVGWWYHQRLQATLEDLAHEHQQAEQNLTRVHLLLETTRRLVGANHLDALHLLSEIATRLTNAECATIYQVDREREQLRSRVVLGSEVEEIVLPMGVGIAGTVAVSGETINLSDAYPDPRFHPEIDKRSGYKTRSLVTLPITTTDGQIIGVFQVLNSRAGYFSTEALSTLRSLAASAAVALAELRSGH